MNWYLEVLKKYAVFKGRAGRSEYWWFAVGNAIVFCVLEVAGKALLHGTGLSLVALYTLAILLPSIGVGVRRLHDTGRSGWWLILACVGPAIRLISFGPMVVTISKVVGLGCGLVLFIFYCIDSDRGENKYGPKPSAVVRG